MSSIVSIVILLFCITRFNAALGKENMDQSICDHLHAHLLCV